MSFSHAPTPLPLFTSARRSQFRLGYILDVQSAGLVARKHGDLKHLVPLNLGTQNLGTLNHNTLNPVYLIFEGLTPLPPLGPRMRSFSSTTPRTFKTRAW